MDDRHGTDFSVEFMSQIDNAGELPLRARRSLMQEAGRRLLEEKRVAVYEVRLGLICAMKVWGKWVDKFPGETYLLDLASSSAESIVTGSKMSKDVIGKISRFRADLDAKLNLGEEYFSAIYAGSAAWAVARDAVAWSIGNADVVSGDSELDVSPDDWSPCFFASLAAVGGAVWEGIGDPLIRRDFWIWYLTSAIPEAYSQASSILGWLNGEGSIPARFLRCGGTGGGCFSGFRVYSS